MFAVAKPYRAVVLMYAFLATVWILTSDGILSLVSEWPVPLLVLEMVKGLLFVTFTSGVLFVLLRRTFNQQETLQRALHAQMQHSEYTQTSLRESEARFRKAVEQSPMPMIIFDDDGRILSISQS